MKISLPTVGPIVGYTTERSTRIWLRGEFRITDGQASRCYGVIRFRKAGDDNWSKPHFNKLEPHFDVTGVFVIEALQAISEYEYQAGWFFADTDLEKVKLIDATMLEWPAGSFAFFSGSDDANLPRSYAVGSCRYLLRLFGGAIFDERGDKCFSSILEQVQNVHNPRPIHGMLMIGDQIYADDLRFFGKDVTVDDFLERYRLVFSQPGIRALMARVPTYMILDDHEIEDNWPSRATPKDRLTMYPHAVHAYQIYQCSHSPIFAAKPGGGLVGTLPHFWYHFSDGCADWFVLDARTERKLGNTETKIIGNAQMGALKEWLVNGSNKIKFVVSSVPFIPDLKNDGDDKWGAFVSQRDELVSYIFEHAVQKVVFVSGDVHSSFTCQLRAHGNPDFFIHQIVSSSFFWPYPHMRENDFAFDADLISTDANKYHVQLTSQIHSEDNFARIDATSKQINVTFFSRKGEQLANTNVLSLL